MRYKTYSCEKIISKESENETTYLHVSEVFKEYTGAFFTVNNKRT